LAQLLDGRELCLAAKSMDKGIRNGSIASAGEVK
jgi:hypothetical protein